MQNTEGTISYALWNDEAPEITESRKSFAQRTAGKKVNIFDQIAANKINSALLLGVFLLLAAFLGYFLGAVSGAGLGLMVLALIIAAVQSFAGFYYSDRIILSISKARPLQKKDHPFLFHIVEALSIGQGIPVPAVYIIDDSAPNAFATGRDPQNAVIAVTSGLLDKLDRYELEGVIAHELSHIRNYDIRLSGLVTILAGAIALLSDIFLHSFRYRRRNRENNGIILLAGIVLAILAPLAAVLIQMAISRKREYLADASAAYLTKYPEGLAKALEKIALDTEPLEAANKATAHLYIVNPLTEHKVMLNNLFSTHPPVSERIRILRGM